MTKVLVVEDEKYAREAVVKQIERYDQEKQFTIFEAANGSEGWELFVQEHPDLILTDIRMPVMDGLQLLARIREEDQDVKVVILSAYSDFEYARQAVRNRGSDYLLKPVSDETLAQCLDSFLLHERKARKEQIITGQDMVTQYIRKRIADSNYCNLVENSVFQKIYSQYQIALVWFADGRKPEIQKFIEEMERIYGSAFWTGFRFITEINRLWILVTDPAAEDGFFHRRTLSSLAAHGFLVCMGVSGLYSKGEEIPACYADAELALKHKIYEETRPYFAEDVSYGHEREWYFDKQQEMQLFHLVEEGKTDSAMALLNSVFDEVERPPAIRLECLELLYTQLMLIFRRAIGVEDRTRATSLSLDILRFESLKDMRMYCQNIVVNICTMGRPKDRTDPVAVMKKYADEHYSSDITVREIAEKVLFMNQDYLSHIFTRAGGIGFTEYLRKIRIRHAKEYLSGKTKYSVAEVAALTGYNDTSQFIRAFRQETGMTPGEYRSKGDHDENSIY